ncbi:MAG: hypothetical protein AAF408_19230, partial [Pseudomonadota bacterium]
MTDAQTRVNSIVTRRTMRHAKTMKTQAALFTSFVLLVSCGPLSMYYRTGVTVTRQQTDLTECEVAALRDAPVANQIRQGPPVFYPGDRYCNRGHCWRTGGYW